MMPPWFQDFLPNQEWWFKSYDSWSSLPIISINLISQIADLTFLEIGKLTSVTEIGYRSKYRSELKARNINNTNTTTVCRSCPEHQLSKLKFFFISFIMSALHQHPESSLWENVQYQTSYKQRGRKICGFCPFH